VRCLVRAQYCRCRRVQACGCADPLGVERGSAVLQVRGSSRVQYRRSSRAQSCSSAVLQVQACAVLRHRGCVRVQTARVQCAVLRVRGSSRVQYRRCSHVHFGPRVRFRGAAGVQSRTVPFGLRSCVCSTAGAGVRGAREIGVARGRVCVQFCSTAGALGPLMAQAGDVCHLTISRMILSA